MQVINLTVENQIITPDCITRVVVAGAKSQVYAQFTLDAEWNGLTVVVIFANDFYDNGQGVEKIWTGEPMEIPPEVLVSGTLRIGLNGFGEDGILMLPTAYMPNGIRVYRNGGLIALQSETTTPALWEQALGQIGQISELETRDKTSLVAAMNEVRSSAYAYTQNAPSIQDGNWWLWDIEQGEYVDTGQRAQGPVGPVGNVMYATFTIDPATGILVMTTPDGYTGPEFAINEDGYLEVQINA